MLFLTKWFGVTGSDAERNLGAEQACVDEIVERVLLLQANAAAQQHRPLGRGTHFKGTCARATFEVFDLTSESDPVLAERLAKGIFARPGIYPAVVRFGNADPKKNSDFKADVRSLSFSVDLTRGGKATSNGSCTRQDFSLQNTTTLPINDARAFLAMMKLLTASNPAMGLWLLPLRDKLRVVRSLILIQGQAHQKVTPYQRLRYGSNVPFRHGPKDVVKYSATPSPDNSASPLRRSNPNALQHELRRHLRDDRTMSAFEFGVQFLNPDRMTYWHKQRDANFWVENASIKWNEVEAPIHTVARLTLLPRSTLSDVESEAVYFDVTGNATCDSMPLGSINRARSSAEAASREARSRNRPRDPQVRPSP